MDGVGTGQNRPGFPDVRRKIGLVDLLDAHRENASMPKEHKLRLMRKLAILSLLSLTAVVLCAKPQNPPSATKPTPTAVKEAAIEAEVTKRETARREAFVKGDHAALSKILSEDYLQITSYGDLRNRNHILNAFRSGDLRYDSIVNRDVIVIVDGDTALVTGIGIRKGREKDRDLSGTFRFSRVWVKRKGEWVLFSQHSTKQSDK